MNTLYYLRLDWFSLTDVQPWIEHPAETPVPPEPEVQDTHDGFWRKKYREMWERKPKLPDLEEIIEAVQESPKAAIEAVPEVKQTYPDIDYTQVRANLQLQTFIAQQILVVLELRRLQDEDDIEAFLLLS